LNQNAHPATKIILQKCAREPEFRRRNYKAFQFGACLLRKASMPSRKSSLM
jgi:hypothetical protein